MAIIISGTWMAYGVRADEGSTDTNQVTRLPAAKVIGERLEEDQPVGPYQQPEWTTARRFATTRVYLQQPPWGFGVEQWVKMQYPRGEAPNYLLQEEVEMGLPYRFQADVYENWIINEHHTVYHHDVATELRWALADWGKIPLNPTLYGEWKFVDADQGADVYELKLLFGEDLAPRWHWGLNLIYEQEVGQSRTTEWEASQGVSYTVIDEKLGLGVEIKVESETEQGARSNAPIEVDIGPSLQWRPTRGSHLDVVPLFGVTGDSPNVETWIVFGIDFGPGHERASAAPVSTSSQ
ncbi:MAG TPA: hypothetical protein VLZ12_08690 [Verrucomicrobiae bacterium]|nr:hypothetical protein [Verrucomicrobiae bacterium]